MDDLTPAFVTAKNIDFFRGELNTKLAPCIGDDWQMCQMRVEDVKAFFYPAEEDALLWARWGGSGLDMHTNQMDEEAEDGMGDGELVKHEKFVELIRPSLPEKATKNRHRGVSATPSHRLAVFFLSQHLILFLQKVGQLMMRM